MHSTRHQRSSRKLSDQPFNIPDKYLGDLPENTTYGKGGFREARLLVDGQLAGAAFPYVVIYTGGFTPAAWRRIVSYLLASLPTDLLGRRPIPSYAVRPAFTALFAKMLTSFLGV